MRIKILALTLAAGALLASCGDDDDLDPVGISSVTSSTDTDDDTSTTSYTIPDYDDDYSSIASWSNKDSWNLANVHDPSVAYWTDGYYYMFGTDASYGNAHESCTSGKHFQGKRSKDLVNWEWVPGPMDAAPDWVADSLNNIRSRMELDAIADDDISYGYWAPVIRQITVDGETKIRMYYSIVIDNYIGNGLANTTANFDYTWTERAFIGMTETTDPDGGPDSWTDMGYVVCSSSDKGTDYSRASSSDYDAYFYYNAIDPTYIVTPEDEHWLIYGSWHSGFAALQLDPSTGKPLNDLGEPYADSASDLAERYGRRVGTRTASSRWQGSEGPEIIYKDGYYYLFMAYDALDVPYNTRVVRSTSIDGSEASYYDITGRNFTNGRGDCYPIVTHPYNFAQHSGWVGISHCCIFQDADDENQWYYMSQARLPANTNGNAYSNAIMMGHVRKIVWAPSSASALDDLWPIALPERYAGIPDLGTITADSLIGKWQFIDLAYSYGNQQSNADSYLVLSEDGTYSGPIEGTWSYDEENKYLYLDDVVVCVEREADWEEDPRVATFVFAGYAGASNSYATWWGKKAQ